MDPFSSETKSCVLGVFVSGGKYSLFVRTGNFTEGLGVSYVIIKLFRNIHVLIQLCPLCVEIFNFY